MQVFAQLSASIPIFSQQTYLFGLLLQLMIFLLQLHVLVIQLIRKVYPLLLLCLHLLALLYEIIHLLLDVCTASFLVAFNDLVYGICSHYFQLRSIILSHIGVLILVILIFILKSLQCRLYESWEDFKFSLAAGAFNLMKQAIIT